MSLAEFIIDGTQTNYSEENPRIDINVKEPNKPSSNITWVVVPLIIILLAIFGYCFNMNREIGENKTCIINIQKSINESYNRFDKIDGKLDAINQSIIILKVNNENQPIENK